MLRQLLGFLGKLLVGLLELSLLRLQFPGELLRLLQERFGLHGGFDAVKNDTDTGSQLFQERQVRHSELIE